MFNIQTFFFSPPRAWDRVHAALGKELPMDAKNKVHSFNQTTQDWLEYNYLGNWELCPRCVKCAN